MRKNIGGILTALAIAATIASFYFDSKIIVLVSSLRTGFFDQFFLGITLLSSEIIIFFILTSLFLWNENKRKWILPLWLTLFFSVAASFLLKIAVHRQRPFQCGLVSLLPSLQESSFAVWNFSFPSFQAMLAFSAIPILSKEFPKLKYAWIILAVFVAFSRVYFGLHFLSDIIAGGLIGYVIGIIILKYEKERKIGEKIYRKIFGE